MFEGDALSCIISLRDGRGSKVSRNESWPGHGCVYCLHLVLADL